jgi:hypothetical protein
MWLPDSQVHPLVWWVPPPLCWPLGSCDRLQPAFPLLPVLTGPLRPPHPNIMTLAEALRPSVDRILATIPPPGVPSLLMGGLFCLGGPGEVLHGLCFDVYWGQYVNPLGGHNGRYSP